MDLYNEATGLSTLSDPYEGVLYVQQATGRVGVMQEAPQFTLDVQGSVWASRYVNLPFLDSTTSLSTSNMPTSCNLTLVDQRAATAQALASYSSNAASYGCNLARDAFALATYGSNAARDAFALATNECNLARDAYALAAYGSKLDSMYVAKGLFHTASNYVVGIDDDVNATLRLGFSNELVKAPPTSGTVLTAGDILIQAQGLQLSNDVTMVTSLGSSIRVSSGGFSNNAQWSSTIRFLTNGTVGSGSGATMWCATTTWSCIPASDCWRWMQRVAPSRSWIRRGVLTTRC